MTVNPDWRPTSVAAYVRVSSKKQAERYGPDAQKEEISRYCAFRSWPSPQWYEDAESGATTKRDHFQELVEAVRSRQHDVVITRELSRVGRNALDLLWFARKELDPFGCRFVVTSQGIDTSTPAGKLLFTMLAGIAEYERDMTAERVIGGKREAVRRGGSPGGSAPLGYSRVGKKLVINEDEAEAVRTIFSLRAQGVGPVDTAELLNTSGVPTRAAREGREGSVWFPQQVSRVLAMRAFYDGSAADKQAHEPILVAEVVG